MDDRIIQFRVGVTVLAAFIVTGILVLLFGEIPGLIRGTYTIYVVFPQAPGVSRDTPVRKSGILIGRVTEVDLADDAGVVVAARIDQDRKLRRTEVCQIRGSLLGGDAILEFVPSGQGQQAGGELKDGDRIVGLVASDPLQVISSLEGSLSRALNSVAGTSDEIGRLTRRVTDLLAANDEQFTRIVGKTEQAVDGIRVAVDGANEILGDQVVRQNLSKALADLPRLMEETHQTIEGMQRTMQLAERNLQNLEGITKPLSQRGDRLVNNIDHATAKLDEILTELSVFGRALNSPEGSLGQLLKDPTLYQNVSETVANINALSRDLRPIIRDARALSDKISRHPELLGVGGALRGSSGIK